MVQLIDSLLYIFNLEYTLTNLISVYMIIKILKRINYRLCSSRRKKQTITFIVSILTASLFAFVFDDPVRQLLPSAMFSIISYDYIIKILLEKLKIK